MSNYAKADRDWDSSAVYGNRLDFLIRQAQSGQTVGIPVGPDASKVVSEIIGSAVDRKFLEISGRTKPTYIRHVDDYWIGGQSQNDCEKHFYNLRIALNFFEMDINELKTKIVSTREILGEYWPSDVERDIEDTLARPGHVHPAAAVATLGKIMEQANKNNDEGIIKHAIR